MLEWMLGLLVVAILIGKILDAFEVIDVFEVVVDALKLTAGLLLALGAFFVCLITRRGQQKRQ
jgi:small neutral amino acid transporter SnatA (MarC family)